MVSFFCKELEPQNYTTHQSRAYLSTSPWAVHPSWVILGFFEWSLVIWKNAPKWYEMPILINRVYFLKFWIDSCSLTPITISRGVRWEPGYVMICGQALGSAGHFLIFFDHKWMNLQRSTKHMTGSAVVLSVRLLQSSRLQCANHGAELPDDPCHSLSRPFSWDSLWYIIICRIIDMILHNHVLHTIHCGT